MPTPEFVLTLRAKIGHDPLPLPGVTAVVLDDRNRVLLVRPTHGDRWTLVTGCLDPGEQPAAGALREIMEETGVVATVERLLSVTALDMLTCPNGDLVHWYDTALRCRYVSGEARVNDDESVDVGWFEVDTVPQLSPHQADCLARALAPDSDAWFEPAPPSPRTSSPTDSRRPVPARPLQDQHNCETVVAGSFPTAQLSRSCADHGFGPQWTGIRPY